MTKLLLTGYEGSKRILRISSYLLNKYVPDDFDIKFLNFGTYTRELHGGEFIPLDHTQVGGGKSWSIYVYKYLKSINDKYVILGVDDHLIGQPVNMKSYNKLIEQLDGRVKCCRLSDCSWYDKDKYDLEDDIIRLHDNAPYLATGQYTLWDRQVLMNILHLTNDIWDFESRGSVYLSSNGYRVCAHRNAPFKYDDRSALSGGKELNLTGVSQEDIDYFIKVGYINHNLTLR
jgi:hypothetical protein